MQAARHLRYRVMLPIIVFAVLGLAAQTKASLIDINRATIAELKTLPGIRDAWAEAIVKNRPYRNKTQLLTRKILPVTAYHAIEGQIIAKQ
jgi:competence protein ComEA